MKNLVLAIIAFLFCLPSWGQDSLYIGVQRKIHSDLLNEDRLLSISLPPSYHNKKYTPAYYPVLYVLDGESSFEFVNGIVQFLSRGVFAHIPEMIVVGVHNTNRTRDFTPTTAVQPSPDDPKKLLFENSGGNANFTKFLGQELIPFISQQYRTTTFHVLMGHSFGGLAATNILLHQPHLFRAYLLHDPSYWWDKGYLIREARKRIPRTLYHKKRVYLSQAENDDKGQFDGHFQCIQQFHQLVDSIGNNSLQFGFKYYPSEDHGTISLPATYEGLKYIFDGYWFNFKELTSTNQLIETHYRRFSEQINNPFPPAEPKLDFIYRYFKANNNMELARSVLAVYQKLYPKTAPASL